MSLYMRHPMYIPDGHFTRSDIERSFGWNPQGGHDRTWRLILVRAGIKRGHRGRTYTAAEAEKIMAEHFRRVGQREYARIERELEAIPPPEPDPPTSPPPAEP